MVSPMLCAAVVAKYLTSTSSSCCSFSRFGKICCCIKCWPADDGGAVWPDFSKSNMVPSAGNRLRMSMRTAYDLATLKRIFGMSSETSLSIIGRIDFSITARLMAGASVCNAGISDAPKSEGACRAYRNCKTSSHSVEVVRVFPHGCDFRNNCIACPLDPKNFC